MNIRMNIIWHVKNIHFIEDTPSREFKIIEYTPIEYLLYSLQELLPYDENCKILKIEYRLSPLSKEGKLEFRNHELKRDTDLRAMWRNFFRLESKVLIELDATVSRSVDDNIKC